jgi:energy-converting hydrogenase Eha subunit F
VTMRTFVDNLCYMTVLRTLDLFLDRTIWMSTFVVASWMLAVLNLLLSIFSPVIAILIRSGN